MHQQGIAPTESLAWPWLLMAALAFVGFYASVAAMRAYYRSVQELQTKLSQFNIEDTMCWCCSLDNHGNIVCDRKVVYRYIRAWFGSFENFEAQV